MALSQKGLQTLAVCSAVEVTFRLKDQSESQKVWEKKRGGTKYYWKKLEKGSRKKSVNKQEINKELKELRKQEVEIGEECYLSDAESSEEEERQEEPRRSGRVRKPVLKFEPAPKGARKMQVTSIAPMLVKSDGRPQYVPWSTQDMKNVMTNLPDLQNGASPWIRVLEEETTGQIMAVGDLKALLGKIVGLEAMLDIFDKAGYQRDAVEQTEVDGFPFNPHRGGVWAAMREIYPTRPDLATLTGPLLKDDEPPATYVHTQLRRWRVMTERDVQTDPIMTSLFRKAILEGLPAEAKRRLEEVVGVNTMGHKEFIDHVVHAVEKQRKEGKRLEEQSREVQRKLLHLQLEELKAKEKKEKEAKKVASVKIQSVDNAFFDVETDAESPLSGTGRSLTETRPMVVYNFSGIPYPTTGQGNTQGGVPNGNNQVRGGPGNGGQKNQWKGQQGQNQQGNNWKQQGPTGQRKQGPIICYGCGQPGHLRDSAHSLREGAQVSRIREIGYHIRISSHKAVLCRSSLNINRGDR